MRKRILALVLATIFLAIPVWAAKVHLKDGSVISGKIEKQDAEKVEVVTPLGVRMMIPMESITEIAYAPGEVKGEVPSELQGYVVKIEGEKIHIDLGSRDGVEEGTVLKVYREERITHAKTDELLRTVTTNVGEIEVVEVYRTSLIAGVISLKSNEQVRFGDLIEIAGLAGPIIEQKAMPKAEARQKGPRREFLAEPQKEKKKKPSLGGCVTYGTFDPSDEAFESSHFWGGGFITKKLKGIGLSINARNYRCKEGVDRWWGTFTGETEIFALPVSLLYHFAPATRSAYFQAVPYLGAGLGYYRAKKVVELIRGDTYRYEEQKSAPGYNICAGIDFWISKLCLGIYIMWDRAKVEMEGVLTSDFTVENQELELV